MPDMNKKTILVVDDDHEIVRAITITLEREGYHVLNAYDGLQARDCVTSREVHLIIIDVMMPKLDGLSAVMKIREKKNLPIIILSAKGEDSDKILGLSMGADDYISKPFNPMELVARVKSQLRRYTDGDGNENRGAFDEAPGPHLPRRGNLQPHLERTRVLGGKHRDGAHPQNSRENRAEPKRAGILESGMGDRL